MFEIPSVQMCSFIIYTIATALTIEVFQAEISWNIDRVNPTQIMLAVKLYISRSKVSKKTFYFIFKKASLVFTFIIPKQKSLLWGKKYLIGNLISTLLCAFPCGTSLIINKSFLG